MTNINEESVRNAFFDYLQYYSGRDTQNLFSVLSNRLGGFGTGADEVSYNLEQSLALYRRDIEQAGKIDIRVKDYKIEEITGDVYVVYGLLDIIADIENQEVGLLNLRITTVFSKLDSRWLLEHMHLSGPMQNLDEGESYPLNELEEKNRKLEELVQKRTEELVSANTSLEIRNRQLEDAIKEIKTLKKLLPICASCKKIRDDSGYWDSVEDYFKKHLDITFTHGLCADCENDIMKKIK